MEREGETVAMQSLMTTFVRRAEADRIGEALQMEQHLWPHETVGVGLGRAQARAGFCPQAAAQALSVLGLDRNRKMGRLMRCEVVQLSRTIWRLWQRNRSEAAAGSLRM